MVEYFNFPTTEIRSSTLHVKEILHELLSEVLPMKRLSTLILLTETVLESKQLSLTQLGRRLALSIQERSGIRRVDRFLGNRHLVQERELIYAQVTHRLVGDPKRPVIVVDWSAIPNSTHQLLRAGLVSSGRTLTLYEEVHPEKK